MRIGRAHIIIILAILCCIGRGWAWNSLDFACRQHTQLNQIIFEDQSLQVLANDLGLDWRTICTTFDEPSNKDNTGTFQSFSTWANFVANWKTKTTPPAKTLQDLLHYVEDTSVPVNHDPANNKFQGNDPSLVSSYCGYANGQEMLIESYGCGPRSPYDIKNHASSWKCCWDPNIYSAKELIGKYSSYSEFYKALLAIHKNRVENEATEYRKYALAWASLKGDPSDWAVRGYSEAISLGREIVFAFLTCLKNPTAWEKPDPYLYTPRVVVLHVDRINANIVNKREGK
jgi:hypothetical protein